jgi:hypothetical protein
MSEIGKARSVQPEYVDEVHEMAKEIPGRWEFSIEVIRVEDDRFNELLPGQNEWRYSDVGLSRDDLRLRLGGDQGHFIGPDGTRHLVSLHAFEGAEFQGARFFPVFRLIPDEPARMRHVFKEARKRSELTSEA